MKHEVRLTDFRILYVTVVVVIMMIIIIITG